LRDPKVADQSQSAGFESDNNADGTDATPITKAVFSNVTLLGGGDTTANALFKGCAHIRRNSGMFAINCILQGYPQALQIDGTKSHLRVVSDTLVMNSIVTCKYAPKYVINAGTVDETTYPGLKANVQNILLNLAGNQFGAGNSFTKLTSPYNLDAPSFVPLTGSPALGTASFNHQVFADDAASASPFFDQTVTYVGAFDGNPLDDWTAGWANFNPTASDAAKPVVTQDCSKNSPKLAVTSVQPVCKTGQIHAYASAGGAPSGTPYEYVWGHVYGTDTTFTDTLLTGAMTELDSGKYAVKVKLGVCYSAPKVIKLARILPKFTAAVSASNSMLVKFDLGKIYLSMSGYSTQLRYKRDTATTWSIWSGNNNQNVYYYGTTPRDSLWRWYDSTKTGGTGPGGHPLLTDPTGKANYFNPASLFANLFVNLTANSKYEFQLRGRCFTTTGAVVFSDTVITSKLYKTLPSSLLADQPVIPTADEAVIDASKLDVVVYPNPGKGIVNVRTTGFTGNIQIRVLNMNGAVVYASKQVSDLKQSNRLVNLSTLSSGNYIVEISDGTKKMSKQISIIK